MQLTFLSEEHPVRTTQSRVSVSAWLAIEGSSPSHLLKSLHGFAPAGWFGRTSPAFSQAMTDETLRDFWATSVARKSPSRTEDGKTRASSLATRTPTDWPTLCVTLNTSEHADTGEPFLSGGAVCSLSDILETGDVPRRFYLTAKACRGILRRAEKRGKSLPPQLARALQAVAGSEPISISTVD